MHWKFDILTLFIYVILYYILSATDKLILEIQMLQMGFLNL